MKIRTKLTLRYALTASVVMSALVASILILAERNREAEFYATLNAEAVTKAHLFLSGRIDPGILHDIYHNNREFINEVEVAVYDTSHRLLYHDATESDIVKETPEMFAEIVEKGRIEGYEGDYQVVGLIYKFGSGEYIVTAAAYDGYGYSKQRGLIRLAISLWFIGMLVMLLGAYLLARNTFRPVSAMAAEADSITGADLGKRLEASDTRDELGELASTLNNMLERLEKSFDNQQSFVSNISHELRTPLAALIAEFELVLLRDRTPKEYREALGAGLDDARKIERLSSGLLDFARADYAPERISMNDTRLDELLLDARCVVLKANPAYNVELIFDQSLDDELCLTVKANEYLLKTAFVNLIENNCKFSPDKTSHVHISHYGPNAVIRFSDTGVGLEKEQLEKIFQPFFRAPGTHNIPGHGIGMALVSKIISLHKAEIEVHSHPGEGTVFICFIPHL